MQSSNEQLYIDKQVTLLYFYGLVKLNRMIPNLASLHVVYPPVLPVITSVIHPPDLECFDGDF